MDDVNNIKNSNIAKKTLKLDKDLSINGKDNQKLPLSLFKEGFAITDDLRELLSIFDNNKNDILDADDIQNLQNKLFEAAKSDKNKNLSEQELLQIFNLKSGSYEAENLVSQFRAFCKRITTGESHRTEVLKEGIVLNSDAKFNQDGSGTLTQKYTKYGKVFKTIVSKYDVGGKLQSTKTTEANKTIDTKYVRDEHGNITETINSVKDKEGKEIKYVNKKFTYNTDGKILKEEFSQKENGKMVSSYSNINTYSKDGKLISSENQKNDYKNKIYTIENRKYNSDGQVENLKVYEQNDLKNPTSETNYEYKNQKLSRSIKTIQQENKHPSTIITNYGEDEKSVINLEHTHYTKGVLYKETYTGQNINNRFKCGLPTEKVAYESDGKTIKEKTINIFDKKGILIGEQRYNKDGNLINEKDFSKIDGKFDTSYLINEEQQALHAAIKAICQTEPGHEALKNNISSHPNGNYTVNLPGAKVTKSNLINGTKKLPTTKVFIKESYVVTAKELEEATLQAGKKYSAGDKNYLLFEIAYEKYQKDVENTIKTNNIATKDVSSVLGIDINENLSEGLANATTFILTGKQTDTWSTNKENKPVCYADSDFNLHIKDKNGKDSEIEKLLEQLKEDFKDGKMDSYAATASLKVSTQGMNGDDIYVGNQTLAIIGVTNDKVILSNPWSQQNPIEIQIEDFTKASYHLSCTKIADIIPAKEPQVAKNNTSSATKNISQVHTPKTQNTEPTTNPEADRYYIIPQGKGYNTLIKEALQQQNIKVTAANITKAKEQFKAANPKAIHVYNGKKESWKGNEYLISNDKVFIPKFDVID